MVQLQESLHARSRIRRVTQRWLSTSPPCILVRLSTSLTGVQALSTIRRKPHTTSLCEICIRGRSVPTLLTTCTTVVVSWWVTVACTPLWMVVILSGGVSMAWLAVPACPSLAAAGRPRGARAVCVRARHGGAPRERESSGESSGAEDHTMSKFLLHTLRSPTFGIGRRRREEGAAADAKAVCCSSGSTGRCSTWPLMGQCQWTGPWSLATAEPGSSRRGSSRRGCWHQLPASGRPACAETAGS